MPNALRDAVDLAVEPGEEPRVGGGLCFSNTAHIAGVTVSAMKPDTDTEITIVIANCL